MNENLLRVKAALVAACTALGTFLGWRGVMALVWVAVMGLDYISGTAAACKSGQWCSAVAREGLWHKGGMIFVVIVSVVADFAMAMVCENLPIGFDWPGIVLPLVLAWYIITELGSILENAVKMGANVPAWLVNILKASAKAVDNLGSATIPDGDNVE